MKSNTIKKPSVVYILSNKKMENIYRVNGKEYPAINKTHPLKTYTWVNPGTTDIDKSSTILVHNSAKSILNNKLYLYTLDATNITVDRNMLVASTDLPIKNVEEGTYGELLQRYNFKVKFVNSDINQRKQLIQKIGKEFIDLMEQQGITKGVCLNEFDYYEDEYNDFIYGFSNDVVIVKWYLWDYNSNARTDNDKNMIFWTG